MGTEVIEFDTVKVLSALTNFREKRWGDIVSEGLSDEEIIEELMTDENGRFKAEQKIERAQKLVDDLKDIAKKKEFGMFGLK